MQSRKSLPILMCLSILVICAFQVYWVGDNYAREKKTLEITAGVAFRETITLLQAKNLKLPELASNPLRTPKQIFIQRNLGSQQPGSGPGVVTMVNSIRRTRSKDSGVERRIIITSDSLRVSDAHTLAMRVSEKHGAYDYLVRLDALQDTLRVTAITDSLQKRLKEEKMDIPFTVTKSTGDEENALTDVAVGFTNPVTYHMNLGNSFPYLVNKIAWPVLFSFLLMGMTIFSFVLMYRNVLRQQKLADIKNDFISNITHELKTPIATVAVAIEAMKSFNAMDHPEKAKEYLDISSNELQRLGLLVDNVLKISLFEKKQVTITMEPLELNQLAAEVIDSMGPQFQKGNAQVSLVRTTEPAVIHGDKLHIISVIYNLLDNALKYSNEKASINVTILANPGFVLLQVTDNGIGIDPSYRSRIFEKFFRVPLGNVHNVKGYGLGLSYVSHIVAQHHGTIDLQSEVGTGTTFTIKLPA